MDKYCNFQRLYMIQKYLVGDIQAYSGFSLQEIVLIFYLLQTSIPHKVQFYIQTSVVGYLTVFFHQYKPSTFGYQVPLQKSLICTSCSQIIYYNYKPLIYHAGIFTENQIQYLVNTSITLFKTIYNLTSIIRLLRLPVPHYLSTSPLISGVAGFSYFWQNKIRLRLRNWVQNPKFTKRLTTIY